MPTCTQSIQQTEFQSITSLIPNTLHPLSINLSLKQLFRLEISVQNTVIFTISLNSSGLTTNVGVSINFYRYSPQNVLHLGSAAITENVMSFQKDFDPGTYIICIGSSRYAYNGTFLGDFTEFQSYAKFKPLVYSGQVLSLDMSVPLPPRGECTKVKYYEIIEGHLPPGLVMTPLGVIEGVLPNLDCIDDNAELSASQNWYYEIDNTWQPWGRQWRFKVRVYLFEIPDVLEEKWFCVRIYNNWSWDKDNLNIPLEYEEHYIEEPNKYQIPDLCCEKEVPHPQFKAIEMPLICDCDKESPIEQSQVLNFLSWYHSNLSFENTNEEIKKFIDEFRQTDLYKKLFKESGLEKTERDIAKELIEEYTNKLIAGRRKEDVDYQMIELKDKENQKLPMTLMGFEGSYMNMSMRLPKDDHIT